ncbi:hypothetical protein Tco_0267072 [Tanacetum coccineum]
MSSSNKSPRDYSRKHKRAILEPWKQSHNLPPSPPSLPPNRTPATSHIKINLLSSSSPPLSLSNSLPKSPPNAPIFDTTPLPPSHNSSNPTSSFLPPQISTQNHSKNHLHELLHLSNLLDINIQHAINLNNISPPSSPFTHPPCLDQVNFHSDFCHCCLGTHKIFNILKDDLNQIKSLIIGPSTLFPSSITTNSP